MRENIQRFLEEIKIGARQSHGNMTLYCVLKAEDADVDFMGLDEALDRSAISITELDEAGSVRELRVTNKSDRKVLMLDGEELVGAKQNRVLNVSVLIAPNSETIIPVSCVERGRWSYRSREFGSAGRAMSPDLKRKKTRSVSDSLRSTGSFESAQGMVWQEIDAKFDRLAEKRSPTMALSDLYDAQRDRSEEYLKAFRTVDFQIGMVVFIDNKLAGVELLDKYDAFRRSHSKLVQSYAMDAIETALQEITAESKSRKARAVNILEQTADAIVETRKSVALGEDIRLESEDVIAAGLEFEGRVLQLSIFPKDEYDHPGRRKSSMSAASRRRDSVVSS
ncbi:MAG: hypothetical protein RDU20_23420 [Desulfomonilaceae bacterium]|nr:hypothetical protein [Desulfomonilaceae bacterium]